MVVLVVGVKNENSLSLCRSSSHCFFHKEALAAATLTEYNHIVVYSCFRDYELVKERWVSCRVAEEGTLIVHKLLCHEVKGSCHCDALNR